MRLVIHPLRILLLAVAVFALNAGPALAGHEPPRLGLTPVDHDGTYFELSLEPGETRRLQVELANFGHDQTDARTYAADVYSIVNGGFGAELFGDEPSGTTRWLDYPTQEATLGPNEAIVVDFTVSVPEGTSPGEYVAALIAENVVPYAGDADDGIAIEQTVRNAIAVAIDVPGPRRPALEIGAVAHAVAADDRSVVSFEVANTGNVHLKPAGEFVLRDAAGEEIAASEPAMDSVYAGSTAALEIPLASRLRAGDYCAELSLADEESGAADATDCLPFAVEPPPADADGSGDGSQTIPVLQPAIDAAAGNPLLAAAVAVGGLGLIAAIIAAMMLWRRRRRERRETLARLGIASPWPTADLPDSPGNAPRVASVQASAELMLRDALSDLPVRRAWLIAHQSYTELAVEPLPGISLDAASRMVEGLQSRVAGVSSWGPLRVVLLHGSGVVERRTGGTAPFYGHRETVPSGPG